VISNRNRPELLSDKDTGLDSDAQYHCGSPADRPSTSNGSCREQNTIATPHQQQPQDIDNTQEHTLSQNTSVGAVSSDEIEEFEDDNSW